MVIPNKPIIFFCSTYHQGQQPSKLQTKKVAAQVVHLQNALRLDNLW